MGNGYFRLCFFQRGSRNVQLVAFQRQSGVQVGHRPGKISRESGIAGKFRRQRTRIVKFAFRVKGHMIVGRKGLSFRKCRAAGEKGPQAGGLKRQGADCGLHSSRAVQRDISFPAQRTVASEKIREGGILPGHVGKFQVRGHPRANMFSAECLCSEGSPESAVFLSSQGPEPF